MQCWFVRGKKVSTVLKRYDVGGNGAVFPDAEGEYVKAQDAYDKCAALR